MKHLEALTLSGRSWCVLSDCERYRYALGRQWDDQRPELCVVMLNPSTADHTVNDATIKTLLRLGPGWGFGGFRVCNLFALRATDPKDLKAHPEPVQAEGDSNDEFIGTFAQHCGAVLVAWGSHGVYLDRAAKVLAGPLADIRLQCLGVTKSGEPRHPLYSRSDAKMEDYRR